MESRIAVSFDDVRTAAESIVAEGGQPTLRSVRERVGRGSLGTIQRHMAAWKADRPPTVAAGEELPPELRQAMLAFGQRRMAAGRAQAEAEIADARQAIEALSAESDRQASEIGSLQGKLARMSDEVLLKAGRIRQLEESQATLREQADADRRAAEQARTELARAQLQLAALPQLQEELARLKAAQQEEIEQLTAAHQKEMGQLKAHLEAMRSQAHAAERTLAGVQAELAAAREMNATLRDLAARDRDAMGKLEGTLAAERGRTEQLQATVTDLKLALQKAESESAALKQRSVEAASKRKPTTA